MGQKPHPVPGYVAEARCQPYREPHNFPLEVHPLRCFLLRGIQPRPASHVEEILRPDLSEPC